MISDGSWTQCVPYDETARYKQPLLPLLPILYIALGACLIIARLPPIINAGAIGILAYALWYTTTTYTSGDRMLDYTVASASATFAVSAASLAFLPDAIVEIRYIDDPQPITEKSLPARFWHAFRILMFPRLIGTNAQHRSIPPAFKGTRSQFLLMRLRQLVTSAIMVEVCKILSGMEIRSWQPLIRPAQTTAWLIGSYLGLEMSYMAASFIAVATRMGSPEDWPDLFGPYTEVYTVSRTWGRAWHQLFRGTVTRWGAIVHRAFDIPRGTLLSGFVLVNVAFAITGLTHSAGDLAYGRACFGRSWPFFALNGLVVSLESVLAPYARRAGISGQSRAWRLLGYVWVWAWFVWSLPPFQRWTVEIRTGGEPEQSVLKDAVLLLHKHSVRK